MSIKIMESRLMKTSIEKPVDYITYFLKGFFINLDLSEKVFVSDIRTAIQEIPFREPAFFDMIAEFYIDLKNVTVIEEVFFTRHFI